MLPNIGWLFRQRLLRLSLVREGGQALVEFAFSLTVLLVLTFGAIDLCRAVYAANVVQAAAQIGARAGVIDITTVVPAVQNRLGGLDPAKAQITASLVSDERVEVEVTYEFEFITPYLSQLVAGGAVNLSGKASMVRY